MDRELLVEKLEDIIRSYQMKGNDPKLEYCNVLNWSLAMAEEIADYLEGVKG